jgi:hypothetical protein
MRALAILLATTALSGAAFAQSNDQYQLRDTTAVTDVEVGSAYDVGATAVASGNVVTTTQEHADSELTSTQHMDGDASATADATVWNATGNVAITSAAISNGGTAIVAGGDVDIEAEQLAHGDATAATQFTGSTASNVGLSASAGGNVAAVSARDASVRLVMDQESTGNVNAAVEGDTDLVTGQAVSGAIASANNLTMGGETATILNATRQTAVGGSVSARSDLYVGYGTDVSGNATANGNSVAIDNQWGYVNAAIEQSSNATISADSYVTLGGDFLGFASAGAYGVGNQAMVSNIGSDTVIDTMQANSGDVSAVAAMSGEGGALALSSAAAYGNSVTGSLCTDCGASNPTLTASNGQVNDGNVNSTAVIRTPYATTVGATSTAIGNAATYQVRPPGG